MDDHRQGSDSALRALRAASDEVEALRSGSLSSSAARIHVLRVANSVDRALRRLLRDDEGIDLSLRLKALAPEEIRIDAVLAELRRADRVPMGLAAGIHELFEARRRMEGEGAPTDADIVRTVGVFDLLDAAVQVAPAERAGSWAEPRPTQPGERAGHAFGSPLPASPSGHPLSEAEAALIDDSGSAVSRPRSWILALVPVAAGLLLLAIWLVRGFGPDPLAVGIELFERGEYEESAQHFWRYSEEHPDEVLPQLYLARVHRRMDRPELAAEAIRQAERIAPDDAAVDRELGFLLLDSGRADVAVDRFRAAVERDADSTEGWVGLVRALRESGRGAEVDAAIEDAPAEVRALLRRPSPAE